jgi:hypothetical protein
VSKLIAKMRSRRFICWVGRENTPDRTGCLACGYNDRRVVARLPEQELRDRFFQAMLEASFPLQAGADQEMTLQALIRAAEMLKERFEQELAELPQESD